MTTADPEALKPEELEELASQLEDAKRVQRLLEPWVREWLQAYPDGLLACRERHQWPTITRPKRKRGPYRPFSRIEHQPDGTSLVEQLCENCGMPRWRLTGAGGIFSATGRSWHYLRHPDGYNQPPGYGLTATDFKNEAWRRFLNEEIKASET